VQACSKGNAKGYDVTSDATSNDQNAVTGTLSLVPDPVLRIRVRPADLARMLGVSRQSVSRWQKRGLISVGPDGRLDPQEATRQLLRQVDPTKLRARLLRPLAEELEGVRRELELVRGERDAAVARARRLAIERDRLAAANAALKADVADLEREREFQDLASEPDDQGERP
jgi:DNA-binding transcriptional MerR regulator